MKQSGRLVAGVILTSSTLLFAGSVLAEGREDYYTQTNQQRYFDMPENARTVGMAGSSVATSSDSSSVIGNPAGLGFMKESDVSVTYYRDTVSGNDASDYSSIQNDRDGGQALAAINLGPTLDGTPKYGTLGLGWSGVKGKSDDAFNSRQRDYGLHLAYGKDVSDALSLGYGFGYIHKKDTVDAGSIAAGETMNDGILQTVGFDYKISPATTWGVSTSYGFGTYDAEAVNNASGATANVNGEDVHSWGIETGLGHKMGSTLLTGSFDYTNYNSTLDDDSYAWGFKTGVEQSFTEWLKGRLGYRYQGNFNYNHDFGNDNAKYNAVSFGVGVKLASHLYADYGAEYRAIGENDWLHTVSLSVPFSLCKD